MSSDLIIQLAHDSEQDSTEVEYLPWGTRTLKLRLRGGYTGPILVGPEPVDPDDDYIVGLSVPADEGGRLELSWGGGHEEGFRIKDFENVAYVYFNIRHFGPDVSRRYASTIIARTSNGRELARLDVGLTPPAAIALIGDGILEPRWHGPEDGLMELVLHPPQVETPIYIPRYQSRWWPPARSHYVRPQNAAPLIRLQCQRKDDSGLSRITVLVQANSSVDPVDLAIIDGDIQFPLIDLKHVSADLFYETNHWWLRIWFWWLDKGVARRLAGRLSLDEEAGLRKWQADQEIPDAERIDLVLNSELQPVFVATDLHWHEMWASYAGKVPLRASIGGATRAEVIVRGGFGLKVVMAGRARYHLDPPAYNPQMRVLERLKDPGRQALGPGTMFHKHTPFIHDVEFGDEFVSSDVRGG
jgi:hypothetical protein